MATLRYGNDTVSGTGVRFDMRCTGMQFGWKNLNEVENQPGKSIASGLDIRLPAGRYNGHEAPVINATGVIDTSLSDPSYNADGNPYLALPWLGSLALVGSGYLLYPAVTQFLGKAPVATGSISAMVNSVSLSPDADSFGSGSEYIINYSMEFVLVSGPV